jgi:hypothetical protein
VPHLDAKQRFQVPPRACNFELESIVVERRQAGVGAGVGADFHARPMPGT